jgi:hypothetical protein
MPNHGKLVMIHMKRSPFARILSMTNEKGRNALYPQAGRNMHSTQLDLLVVSRISCGKYKHVMSCTWKKGEVRAVPSANY